MVKRPMVAFFHPAATWLSGHNFGGERDLRLKIPCAESP
jgi:hypothetical protein